MMRVHHAAATFASAIVFLGLAACGEEPETTSAPPPPSAETEAPGSLAETGEALVGAICSTCHMELEDGGWSRLEEGRRTPEGWDMTLVRMMNFHGLELSRDERRAIVKYLSDTRGLAPAETADFRYAIERRTNIVEADVIGDAHDDRMMEMCARCHSIARVGLQRRSEDEWRKLMHMHAGQWPTMEYHMLSRDREWWNEANDWVVADLSEAYSYDDPAWGAWQEGERFDLAGNWRYVSYVPGQGYIRGVLRFEPGMKDEYQVSYERVTPDGEAQTGSYSGIVYTGYEWRGAGTFDGEAVREVAALSEDGNRLTGRWFRAERSEVGGTVHAVRVGGEAAIMAVEGESLRRGSDSRIIVMGTDLDGELDLGPGVTVNVVSSTPDEIVADLAIAGDAPVGRRSVRVGTLVMEDAVAVFDEVHRIDVTPGYAIARVGGGGGAEAIESAQFEAVAMHNGADGEPGTDDDFRIGVMEADWSTEPNDEVAEQMKDAEFAGTISATGLFTPGVAGPNPDRVYSTNNAGDLRVIATVEDGGRTLTGESHLITTVQRWNNPPLY